MQFLSPDCLFLLTLERQARTSAGVGQRFVAQGRVGELHPLRLGLG